jgi:hypothetical protein
LRDPVYAHRLFACCTRIMAESPCQGKSDSTYGLINSAPKAAIRDAMRAKRAWYIYGIVYYYDVFPGSPRHKTKFCFSISLTRTGPNTDTDTKIVTSACAHWNCADDECDEDSKQYETDVRSAFQQKKMAIPPEILTAPPPPKHKWTGVANPPPGEPAWP